MNQDELFAWIFMIPCIIILIDYYVVRPFRQRHK